MTFFMVFLIVCFLATIAVLWCFRGFSRELKRGRKTVGLVVRVVAVGGERPKQSEQIIPRRLKAVTSQPHKALSIKSAGMISLAIVLASRGGFAR